MNWFPTVGLAKKWSRIRRQGHDIDIPSVPCPSVIPATDSPHRSTAFLRGCSGFALRQCQPRSGAHAAITGPSELVLVAPNGFPAMAEKEDNANLQHLGLAVDGNPVVLNEAGAENPAGIACLPGASKETPAMSGIRAKIIGTANRRWSAKYLKVVLHAHPRQRSNRTPDAGNHLAPRSMRARHLP